MAEQVTPRTEYPWWARLTVDAIKSFGVTTVIVCVLLYVTVDVVIPEMMAIANRYCKAVEVTQESMLSTQQRIADTQDTLSATQTELVEVVKSVSDAAQEIVTSERASQEFMETVQEQHETQNQKLETIEQAVVKP